MQTQGIAQIGNDPLEFAYEQEAFINEILQQEPTPILKFFPTAEGFYDYEKNEYIYQYKDHLGNVRVSYKKVGNSLEITDQNDYYPFGMNIPRDKKAKIGTASLYNYKYNGKELQETGMYDYGARMYMPDIGRWGVVDAYSEKYTDNSGYVYVINNPIRYIDPDGNFIRIYFGTNNQHSYEYKYMKNRNYHNLPDYLAHTLKVLDALYVASNVEVDGEVVNLVQNLIDNVKELSIFDDYNEYSFTRFNAGKSKDGILDVTKFIGNINFKPSTGVLFDDKNDLDSFTLKEKYDKNNLKGLKVYSPVQALGHEIGHAFGYAKEPNARDLRQGDLTTKKGSPYFRNAEEKRVNGISQKIDMNLIKIFPKLVIRKNDRGYLVPVINSTSNVIKSK